MIYSNFILLTVSFLLLAAVLDYCTNKIPNWLNITMIVSALGYHGVSFGLSGLALSAMGLLIGLALLFLPFALGGMGAGDVKMMGAVGAALGAQGVFFSFLYTALLGGLWAGALLIARDRGALKRLATDLKAMVLTRSPELAPIKNDNSPRLCYGVAIAAGTLLYLGLERWGVQIVTL